MHPRILAEKISVEFPVFENSHRSLKKTVMHLTTGGRIGMNTERHPVVRALNQLDIDIREGERVALTGHNGCGKTTLLRTLAGIYVPVQGRISICGRTAALLDVATGIDPDASGFENIYLHGITDGLKPAHIRSKIDEIADFTGLGEYLNLPVRTYSSGMQLRLAFAMSTSIEADILIMDEWLSVGDADFSIKAAARLDDMINKASILILASHSPELIARICTRRIQLEHGAIVSDEPIMTRLAGENREAI